MENLPHCERCYDAGINKPADVAWDVRKMRTSDDITNDASLLPPYVKGRQYLCYEHFEILPPDFFEDYVPVNIGRTLNTLLH
jgi:hypothetical protein